MFQDFPRQLKRVPSTTQGLSLADGSCLLAGILSDNFISDVGAGAGAGTAMAGNAEGEEARAAFGEALGLVASFSCDAARSCTAVLRGKGG